MDVVTPGIDSEALPASVALNEKSTAPLGLALNWIGGCDGDRLPLTDTWLDNIAGSG